MDGALTLQKGALTARSAERKTEKEKLRERERKNEREQGERAHARVLWTARSRSRKARPERAAQRERQKETPPKENERASARERERERDRKKERKTERERESERKRKRKRAGRARGVCYGRLTGLLSSSCPLCWALWLGLVLFLSSSCPCLGRAPELCGWALWPGSVSGSCPPLVLVLAAPLNSVAGLCGPAYWRRVWPKK